MTNGPLNPGLFKRLQIAVQRGLYRNGLDGGSVLISKHGQPMVGSYTNAMDPKTGTMKPTLNISEFGESYRVCCPYCGDTRHRLHISHRWGVKDDVTGSRNTNLWHCFNEECEKNSDFYATMKTRIEDDITNRQRPSNPVSGIQKVSAADADALNHFIRPPGTTESLSSLPDDHPLIKYLKERDMSPRKLEKYFKLSYCKSSSMTFAEDRLIVPIYLNNSLKGWQARHIGDCKKLYRCTNSACKHEWTSEEKPAQCPACNHATKKPVTVPKWYTSPGTKLGDLLLNYDVAKAWEYGIVVEGPFDVMKPGTPKGPCMPGPIVGTFGNKITPQQHRMLHSAWGYKTLYLVFDPEEFDRKTLAEYEKIKGNYHGGVVPVPLPNGTDPGSLSHKDFWHHVREAGRIMGAKTIPE